MNEVHGYTRVYFAALDSTFRCLNKGAGREWQGWGGGIHEASLAYPPYERGARIYESVLCSLCQHILLKKEGAGWSEDRVGTDSIITPWRSYFQVIILEGCGPSLYRDQRESTLQP